MKLMFGLAGSYLKLKFGWFKYDVHDDVHINKLLSIRELRDNNIISKNETSER